MKKILSLSPNDWLSGIAQSYHFGRGIWAGSAAGINPFINPQRASATFGLLQAAPAVTDLTASVIVDAPIGWVNDYAVNGDQTLYIQGTGTLYSLNLVTNSSLTAIHTIANMANGVAVFQPNKGASSSTKYLYYWQKTQIGRFDLTTNYVDAQYTGLQDTVHHPTHRLFDTIFYGNKDRLGSLRDDGSQGVTHTTNDLDFGSDYICTTLSDDGSYLVIGITKNSGAVGQNPTYNTTKILFWDTNSSSWEKEWDLDAPDIISIKKKGSTLYALTSTGLFVFNYSTPPQKVYSLAYTDAASVNSTYGGHYSMDVLGEGVIWGDDTRLHYYGKMTPDSPIGYHQLFSVPSGTAFVVCASARQNTLYAGTTTPKFGYYDYSSNGTPDTGVSAESIYIDLLNRYSIERIDVILGSKLASGDALNIGIASVEETSLVDYGGTDAVSFANFGAKSRCRLEGTSLEAENLIIKPTFTSGAVKIKRIDIWGDDVKT